MSAFNNFATIIVNTTPPKRLLKPEKLTFAQKKL